MRDLTDQVAAIWPPSEFSKQGPLLFLFDPTTAGELSAQVLETIGTVIKDRHHIVVKQDPDDGRASAIARDLGENLKIAYTSSGYSVTPFLNTQLWGHSSWGRWRDMSLESRYRGDKPGTDDTMAKVFALIFEIGMAEAVGQTVWVRPGEKKQYEVLDSLVNNITQGLEEKKDDASWRNRAERFARSLSRIIAGSVSVTANAIVTPVLDRVNKVWNDVKGFASAAHTHSPEYTDTVAAAFGLVGLAVKYKFQIDVGITWPAILYGFGIGIGTARNAYIAHMSKGGSGETPSETEEPTGPPKPTVGSLTNRFPRMLHYDSHSFGIHQYIMTVFRAVPEIAEEILQIQSELLPAIQAMKEIVYAVENPLEGEDPDADYSDCPAVILLNAVHAGEKSVRIPENATFKHPNAIKKIKEIDPMFRYDGDDEGEVTEEEQAFNKFAQKSFLRIANPFLEAEAVRSTRPERMYTAVKRLCHAAEAKKEWLSPESRKFHRALRDFIDTHARVGDPRNSVNLRAFRNKTSVGDANRGTLVMNTQYSHDPAREAEAAMLRADISEAAARAEELGAARRALLRYRRMLATISRTGKGRRDPAKGSDAGNPDEGAAGDAETQLKNRIERALRAVEASLGRGSVARQGNTGVQTPG